MQGSINWVDNVNWPPHRDTEADVSRVSHLSERIEELRVVRGLYLIKKDGATLLVGA